MTTTDRDRPPAPAVAENPFAAPRSALAAGERRAYSLGQVVFGTIAGSLICTAFMLRANYLAFAQRRNANIACCSLVACELVLTAISLSLPGYWFSVAAVVASVVLVSNWYTSRMQRAYTAYVRMPNRRASNWLVLRLVLLSLVAITALTLAIFEVCDLMGIVLPE